MLENRAFTIGSNHASIVNLILAEKETQLAANIMLLETLIREGQEIDVWLNKILPIFDKGVDINAYSNEHWKRPVNIAAMEGNLDILRLLIKKGADINRKDAIGWTILHEVLYFKSGSKNTESIAKLLIENGAQLNGHFEPVLNYAICRGYKDIVNLMLDKGADVNPVTHCNGNFTEACCTPLGWASAKGLSTIVKILIDHGASINQKDSYEDKTALHYAAINGFLETTRLLLSAGASINVKDFKGLTPIHCLCRAGNYKTNENIPIIKLLLSTGADLNVKSNAGETPLLLAISENSLELVKILIDYGADISQTYKGLTLEKIAREQYGNTTIANYIKSKR